MNTYITCFNRYIIIINTYKLKNKIESNIQSHNRKKNNQLVLYIITPYVMIYNTS